MDNKKKIALGATALGGVLLVVFMYFVFSKEKKTQIVIEGEVSENDNDAEMMDEAPAANDDQAVPTMQEQVSMDEKKIAPIPEAKVSAPKNEEIEAKISPIKIVDRIVDFGYQRSSGRIIDTVVIHSSYNSLGGDFYDISAIIDIYEQYGVAAHYLIGREGKIYRLVEDKNIAYHAGVSQVPDGRKNVNDFSIGIEMVNTKTDKMTSKQYEALNGLIKKIKNENKIKYVLGHDQIAPGRKDDPWNFEWDKL